MISVRIKAAIWWGKHGMSLTKQVMVSHRTVQVTQNTIVESKNINTVDSEISNMNIDDQLKMIRKEKHQEYLLNTGCKSLSLENTHSNENTKQFSDPQARKENKGNSRNQQRISLAVGYLCNS